MSGTDSPWKVYTRLLGFARPYRGLLLLAGVGMLLEAGAGGAFAKLMESVVDETFIKRDEAKSLLLPAYIVGLFVIRGIAGYVTDMGMGKAARRGVLMKGGPVLETMARAESLVIDKTGTLTAGHPDLVHANDVLQKPYRFFS